jgi:hypothetical protein
MSESDLRSNIFQPLRDLTEKSNRLLIQFLDMELDLGLTFCDTARIENVLRDVSGTDAALQNVRNAIETVQHFLPRVRDEVERHNIQTRLTELECGASSLGLT